jgi:hypothetical protein
MTPGNIKYKRLVALFLLGLVLLNYPILSLLNPNTMISGLPLLYIYIFGIWGLLIFLSALVTSQLADAVKWKKAAHAILYLRVIPRELELWPGVAKRFKNGLNSLINILFKQPPIPTGF